MVRRVVDPVRIAQQSVFEHIDTAVDEDVVDRLPSALGFGDRDGHRTDRDARPAHLAARR